MIRFADPWFLLLILLVIPLFYFGRKGGGRIRFSTLENLKNLKAMTTGTVHPRLWLLFLRSLALVLFVLAVARPQTGKKFSEITSQGVDIILTLDTSGSMKALDFLWEGRPMDRLEVIKRVASEFIDKRPNDRMGLVVFGDEAFTQCPLTLDHGIILDFLSRIEIGMAGEATAIGSAIGTSVNRMKDLKAKSKIIVLMTDGENTAGRIHPLKAAELAKTFGIKIYTIGVGSRGKAPYLVDTFFGKRYVYQDVNIDEDSLKEVARISGGKYFRATDTQGLSQIYEEIDKLERTEIQVKEYTEYNEIFPYFLLAGLLILLMEIVLSQTRLRIVP